MGFWDSYEDLSGGGEWIKADEKNVLAENGIPVKVTKVVHDPDNQYGERYVLFLLAPDPETGSEAERKIGFASGSGADSRDRMLAGMVTYFAENPGEEIAVKIVKKGRGFYLEQA